MVERKDLGSYIGVMESIIKEIGNKEICMVQEHLKIRMESKLENGLKESYNDIYNKIHLLIVKQRKKKNNIN